MPAKSIKTAIVMGMLQDAEVKHDGSVSKPHCRAIRRDHTIFRDGDVKFERKSERLVADGKGVRSNLRRKQPGKGA